MMIALLLLAAAPESGHAEATAELVSQPAVLEAFRAFCVTGGGAAQSLEAAATAAGFHPVPVKSSSGWEETGAWQRGGLRAFNLSGGIGRPALCGVSARIDRLGEDGELLNLVGAMAGSAFIEGNPGAPRSSWNIAGRNTLVRVSIDRTDQADVGVVLLAQPWPGEAAK